MMKRWITAAMAVVMAASLAGCAGAMTGEQRYDEILQKSAEISSMECDSRAKLKMAVDGEVLEMNTEMLMQVNRDEDRLELAMKTATEFMGQTVEGESFYKDGYLYSSSMGQKFMVSFPLEQMLEQISAQSPTFYQSSELDLFRVERTGSDYLFTYSLKPERLNEYVRETTAALFGTLPLEAVRITAMNGYLVADKENNIKNQTMRISMQIDLGGQLMDVAMELAYDYRNVGGPVTIEFPGDLDSYMQVG